MRIASTSTTERPEVPTGAVAAGTVFADTPDGEPETTTTQTSAFSAVPSPGAEPEKKARDQWKGRQVGHFRLQRLLGTGSMSVVIQAEDLNLGRTVALKFLKKHVKQITQSEQAEQFFREARCAAALEHPNIVQIYGFEKTQGRWFMVMEHMEGGSLLQLIERTGPLSPRRACMFLADAASGIAEAHAAGLLHRDIKPANLLLTRTARCKVADFGLVRPSIDGDDFRLSHMPVGSRHYVAPEIVRNEPATPAADVYGLAATLYAVMTGRPPFPTDDRQELDRLIRKSPPPDIRQLVPHAPARIAELIQHCMGKAPKMRPSAHEFASVLRGELADLADTDSLSSVGSSAILRSASAVAVPSPMLPSPVLSQPSALPVAGAPVPAVEAHRFFYTVIAVAAMVVVIALCIALLRPGGTAAVSAIPAAPPAAQQQIVEVSALKARTDLMFDRLSRFDGGQGMRAIAEQAAQLRGESAGLLETRQLEEAGKKLQALLALCQRAETLEATRSQAAARSREAAEQRQIATSAGAAVEAGSPMAAALEQDRIATKAFEEGRFQEAADGWAKVKSQYEAAGSRARTAATEQAAQRRAELDRQIHDLQVRATDLAAKAREGDTSASARAIELLNKALALQPGNDLCLKLKTELMAVPARKGGDRLENSIGMVLSYIPAGTFAMGSPVSEKARDEDENQMRATITRAFYMARTEVTQSQWQAVMGEHYRSPDGKGDATQFIGPDMPVQNVSWNDATAFCRQLSEKEHRTYRLPTEAEWEYACRGGSNSPFNTGDNLTAAQAQIDASEPYAGKTPGRIPTRPQRVASYPPSAWGLYDMHGNVGEWCGDWYGPYAVGEATDPKGPAQPASLESANRVVRGGAWCHPARTARSASRASYSPVIKTNYIGFRLVLEVNDK